jgi:hypothetical protein
VPFAASGVACAASPLACGCTEPLEALQRGEEGQGECRQALAREAQWRRLGLLLSPREESGAAYGPSLLGRGLLAFAGVCSGRHCAAARLGLQEQDSEQGKASRGEH